MIVGGGPAAGNSAALREHGRDGPVVGSEGERPSVRPPPSKDCLLGESVAYERLPYLDTEQYDLGMDTGHFHRGGYDRVVFRGNKENRKFIAFWMPGRQMLAGMAVNVWDVIVPIGDLIRSRADFDDAALTDPDRPLDSLLP
ncbi:oxidoreductase C-terminal domain-containing protein [Streptomyces sp. NPDC096193]|uniref:oxidoreductase C-terminal domain-containing protein n=1 Tax=Streptomyces sp. NPDC096193 TaxID=3155821 RepID=UPI00333055AD